MRPIRAASKVDQAVHGGLAGHVERMRLGIPEIARNAVRLVAIAVEQNGARAGRHEGFRGRPADPARATGDERNLSVEPKAVEH